MRIVAYDMLILCPFFQVVESNFPLYTAKFDLVYFCELFVITYR